MIYGSFHAGVSKFVALRSPILMKFTGRVCLYENRQFPKYFGATLNFGHSRLIQSLGFGSKSKVLSAFDFNR